MSKDHGHDGSEPDADEQKDKKHQVKKLKKNLQWMIDYLEGKKSKLGKPETKDDKSTRDVIAYLEKLYDGLDSEHSITETETSEPAKKKKKDKIEKGKSKKQKEK